VIIDIQINRDLEKESSHRNGWWVETKIRVTKQPIGEDSTKAGNQNTMGAGRIWINAIRGLPSVSPNILNGC